jgi:competence protein ComEA
VLDSLPPTRRRLVAGALLLAVVLLLAGRHLAGAGTASEAAPPPVAPIRADSGPALVVHVVGAVHRPGLYRFSGHSRVADAVSRAGGATRHADLALINLAAPLADGTQVVVPVKAPAGTTGSGAGTATAPAGPVHLNVATLEQLDSLPGVGPVSAQKILDYRQKHGAFSSLEELDAIPGIGSARIEQLRDAAAP